MTMTTINKKAAIKGIYEKLESIGHDAAKVLRRFDMETETALADAREELNKGERTPTWYETLKRERKNQRFALKKTFDAKFDELLVEGGKTIDDAMMPAPDELDAGALEILREFTVTAVEFEKMAHKYEDASNFSMLRWLDSYRKEHSVDTSWRFQDGAQRKEDLNKTIFSVAHCYDPQYRDDPENDVTRAVGRGYQALQGADQTAFPVPEVEPTQTILEKLSARGITIF